MSLSGFTLQEAIDYIRKNDTSEHQHKKIEFLLKLQREIESCDRRQSKKLTLKGQHSDLKIVVNFSENS